MRTVLIASGIVGLVAMAGGMSRAAAEPVYQWCAHYGGMGYGGAENCGFVTREQCMATVSGIGGHCQMNINWPPAVSEPRTNRRKTPAR